MGKCWSSAYMCKRQSKDGIEINKATEFCIALLLVAFGLDAALFGGCTCCTQ